MKISTKNLATIFLLGCLLFSPKLINAQCHIDDWTALKALYKATDGDNWKKNSGWEMIKNNEPLSDCDLGDLYGVILNDVGRVIRISVCFIK